MRLIRLMLGLLPACRLKNRLMSWSSRSWTIDRTARIGPVVLLDVQLLTLGPGAVVGPFNMFRDLRELTLGTNASIGQFNWFTGGSAVIDPALPTAATFRLGDESVVLSRHYLDCGGGILLAPFSGIAGNRSTLMSHSINPVEWGNDLAPIVLGTRVLLSTNCVVLPGVTIAERIMVAAGSTVVRDLTESDQLYAGTPAKAIRNVAGAGFFTTETLKVDPSSAPTRRADG